MMLIGIVYLACAAFVLIHLGRAPHVEDDALPDDVDAPSQEGRGDPGAGKRTDAERQEPGDPCRASGQPKRAIQTTPGFDARRPGGGRQEII